MHMCGVGSIISLPQEETLTSFPMSPHPRQRSAVGVCLAHVHTVAFARAVDRHLLLHQEAEEAQAKLAVVGSLEGASMLAKFARWYQTCEGLKASRFALLYRARSTVIDRLNI